MQEPESRELTSHRTRSLLRIALLGLFQERLELVIIQRHRADGLEQFVRTQSLVRDHLGEELGAQVVALLQQERAQAAQQAERCSQEERVSVDQVEVPDAEGALERERGTEEREEPGQEVDAAVEADVLEVGAEVGEVAHQEVIEDGAVRVELQRSRHSGYFRTAPGQRHSRCKTTLPASTVRQYDFLRESQTQPIVLGVFEVTFVSKPLESSQINYPSPDGIMARKRPSLSTEKSETRTFRFQKQSKVQTAIYLAIANPKVCRFPNTANKSDQAAGKATVIAHRK